MAPSIHDEVISALIAQDGRGAAGRVLRILVGYTRSRSAALLDVRLARNSLFASVDLTQEALDVGDTAWKEERTGLKDGRTLQRDGFFVSRIRDSSTALVGLLVLESPKAPAITENVSAVERLLAEALLSTNQAENRGEALRRALEENEWNLSRVARIFGVTRVTIYDWLRRYKIPRHRVVRGTK